MMRTALFVALCVYSATASDQSRMAQELDEDLSPEEPGYVPAPLNESTTNAIKDALPAATANVLFGEETVTVTTDSVNTKFADAGYAVNASFTTKSFPGTDIPVITFVIKAVPVATASEESATIAVVLTVSMNTVELLADLTNQKTALGLNLAIDLGVKYSQISNLKVKVDGQTYGREAQTLSTGDVEISFDICNNAGCLGTSTVEPSAYTADQLALAAFDRPATAVTFASVTAAFPLNFRMQNNEVGVAVDATVKGVPEQKTDSTSNVLFFMGVDVDWALISASPALYKKAWQFAIANTLVINPFRVKDIAFVRMQTTTTVSRRAEAQATERVNAHQTVCGTSCAPNSGTPAPPSGTPKPTFSDDDDSSIIAVAVIVPIAVIAIVLVIVWYLLCGDEEKKDPVAGPYGDEEQAPGPDVTDAPIPPAEEDEAI